MYELLHSEPSGNNLPRQFSVCLPLSSVPSWRLTTLLPPSEDSLFCLCHDLLVVLDWDRVKSPHLNQSGLNGSV